MTDDTLEAQARELAKDLREGWKDSRALIAWARRLVAGTRDFPIQSSQRYGKPHPTLVPWSIADKAYSVYSARYGRPQSLERLGERGGFGPEEMDEFCPGWIEESSEIVKLRRLVAESRAGALREAKRYMKHDGPCAGAATLALLRQQEPRCSCGRDALAAEAEPGAQG